MGTEISDERLCEIINFWFEHGEQDTADGYGINIETLSRYKRMYKARFDDDLTKKKAFREILNQYTEEEIKAIAKGGRIVPGYTKAPILSFDGDYFKFAHFTDLHIGSVYFDPSLYKQALEECDREDVMFECYTGDITEGMSNRPGHVYELTEIGYTAQKKRAVELLSYSSRKKYMIAGNHDWWFMKSNGANIVEDIAEEIGAYYLGHNEGDIPINGVVMKLWHGEDGDSYALSYRVQKIIEAFTGGEKPHILLCGHTHKYIKLFDRNVHAISGGAICKQSHFMRMKRRPNHTGFCIIEVWTKKGTVVKLRETFYPFYQ